MYIKICIFIFFLDVILYCIIKIDASITEKDHLQITVNVWKIINRLLKLKHFGFGYTHRTWTDQLQLSKKVTIRQTIKNINKTHVCCTPTVYGSL